MTDLPTTSVVIPTHGRRALLEDVLAPVLADPATTEVVVVVDGCDDGSIEFVEGLRRHDERLVPAGPRTGARAPPARPASRPRAARSSSSSTTTSSPSPASSTAMRASTRDRDGIVVVGYAPVEAPEDSAETRRRRPLRRLVRGMRRGIRGAPREPARELLGGERLAAAQPTRCASGCTRPCSRRPTTRTATSACAAARRVCGRVYDRRLRARHRYRRSFAALRRDAHTSGVGRWRIHDEHGDVVGSLPSDAFAAGLPPVRAALVGLSRRPRLRRLLRTGLAGAVHATTPRGPRAVRSAAALLDLRIGQQKAAIAASREVRESLPVTVVIPAYDRPAMVAPRPGERRAPDRATGRGHRRRRLLHRRHRRGRGRSSARA